MFFRTISAEVTAPGTEHVTPLRSAQAEVKKKLFSYIHTQNKSIVKWNMNRSLCMQSIPPYKQVAPLLEPVHLDSESAASVSQNILST